jgi:hypothetical protein
MSSDVKAGGELPAIRESLRRRARTRRMAMRDHRTFGRGPMAAQARVNEFNNGDKDSMIADMIKEFNGGRMKPNEAKQKLKSLAGILPEDQMNAMLDKMKGTMPPDVFRDIRQSMLNKRAGDGKSTKDPDARSYIPLSERLVKPSDVPIASEARPFKKTLKMGLTPPSPSAGPLPPPPPSSNSVVSPGFPRLSWSIRASNLRRVSVVGMPESVAPSASEEPVYQLIRMVKREWPEVIPFEDRFRMEEHRRAPGKVRDFFRTHPTQTRYVFAPTPDQVSIYHNVSGEKYKVIPDIKFASKTFVDTSLEPVWAWLQTLRDQSTDIGLLELERALADVGVHVRERSSGSDILWQTIVLAKEYMVGSDKTPFVPTLPGVDLVLRLKK